MVGLRDSRDRALFPTKGLLQTASVQVTTPAGGTPLEYYKLNYLFSWYYPVFNDEADFVFNLRGTFGYGNGYGQLMAYHFLLTILREVLDSLVLCEVIKQTH